MISKRVLIFLLYILVMVVFGQDYTPNIDNEFVKNNCDAEGEILINPIYDINFIEAIIPMPDVQYTLPENLVGEFFIINSSFDQSSITIYPNNKFITEISAPGHLSTYGCGYIIKRNNIWYFSVSNFPLWGLISRPSFISDFTEITLSDKGFSFYRSLHNEVIGLDKAIRKIDVSQYNIASNISIPWKNVKHQYYTINQSGTRYSVEFREILLPFLNSLNSFSHRLRINEGFVDITLTYSLDTRDKSIEIAAREWQGFFEITSETADVMNGIIRFTNGFPFYFTDDGTAMIEISNDGIVITMSCSAEVEAMIHEKIPDAQSPVYLILEF